MGKITLRVFHPNNVRSILVEVPFDETLQVIITMLVNNFFIEGNEYYVAQIKHQDKLIDVNDFSRKLNEMDVDTSAFLFISKGSEVNFKAPSSPPRIVEPSPTELVSEKPQEKKVKKKTFKGMDLSDFGPRPPSECISCEKTEWVRDKLEGYRQITIEKGLLQKSHDKLIEEVFGLRIQIKYKKKAAWLIAGSQLISGLGCAILQTNCFPAIVVITAGIIMMIVGLKISF